MNTAPPTPPAEPDRASAFAVTLLVLQGLYYLATGVWPLVSLGSFEAVTGPKTDGWLVQTVGVLIAAIAGVLLVAAGRRHACPEVVLLAVGSAVALTGVDLVFVSRDEISPIYLADAAAEAVLIAAWGLAAAAGALRRPGVGRLAPAAARARA